MVLDYRDGGGGASDYPDDLNKNNQVKTAQDYFTVPITGLKINSTYAFQFQWAYEDDSVSNWSPGFILTTSNETSPAVPTSVAVPETSTGSIPVTLSVFPTNARRVDVIVTGGVFGTSKVAHSFTTSGVATIAAPAGFYTVQLRSVSPSGVTSTVGTTFTVTVADVGETIQSPTNPNGFSSKRILAGIEVSWAGTYAGGTFTGFEAINIYAGNSATATPGTYEQVGVLTGNNVKNTIVIPLGTYVAYGQAVYIHAAAVNKSGAVGAIQSNVTNQALGPGRATDADINDGAVVISKLASDVLTVGNLKAGDINATSFIRAGTASSARVELSSANISGGPSAGFYIYNSAGTAILSAPLSGGLSIVGNGTFTGSITGASGQFDGDLGASGGDFRVRSGQITALAGQIGGWVINESAFKSSSVAFPNIELDPVEAKIHLRGTAGASEIGNFIKMDTTSGLRIGSGASPSFTVSMDGSLTATNATLQKTVGGNTIFLDGSSLRAVGSEASVIIGYDGTVVARNNGSGGGLYSLVSYKAEGTDGYAYLNPNSITIHQNSVFGSETFDFLQYVWNNTLNYAVTGGGIAWTNYYITAGVSTYTTARITTAQSGGNDSFRPLGLSPDGGQWTGPRLYYGSSTTSSAINSELSGGYGGSSQNGDFYFSTA
jgi:hypothetical protein